MKAILLIILSLLSLCRSGYSQSLINFDYEGHQITRFDDHGNAIDAHDGKLSFFNGTYYLYGTSYDCGFEWGNKQAPFCGFKVYTSLDLVQWKDEGFLFDAQSSIWQSRCDGKTYGCFRPHVVFNQKTRRYVLWINVYDNRVGYRVFTATTPVGPFKEQKEPTLAINNDMPVAGLNNGDHDLFVDDDGIAYLAYTDWRTKGSIAIERLSTDYLTGTGSVIRSVTDGQTEAPSLFRRREIYYLVYSDPNCGYCAGTGSSYRTSRSPLGPWSGSKKISDNSCGGQPSFVSLIPVDDQAVYLFGVDLWNSGAKNEAQANFFWAPLRFAPDDSIEPINCQETLRLPSKLQNSTLLHVNATAKPGLRTRCDIDRTIAHDQVFTASTSGLVDDLEIPVFKAGYPDAPLTIEIHKADGLRETSSNALFSVSLLSAALQWGAETVKLVPDLAVQKGGTYPIVMKSKSTTGCYGYAFKTGNPARYDPFGISRNGGLTFAEEPGTSMVLTVHTR